MDGLTAIIPSYNMQSSAIAAATSVLQQDDKIRVIIVDDCSEIPISLPVQFDEYKTRVRLLRHTKNKGAGAARNTGVAASTTDWITFLDSDDKLLPNTLVARFKFALEHDAKISSHMKAGPTLYACGWVENLDSNKQSILRIPIGADQSHQFCCGCWFCPGSTIITRREVFADPEGLIDESIPRLEDLEWCIRFGQKKGQLIVQDIAGVVIEPSGKADLKTVQQGANIIRRRHADLANTNPISWKCLNAYLDVELTTQYYRRKEYFNAALSLIRSYFSKLRFKRHLSPGWKTTPYTPDPPGSRVRD